MQFKTTLLALVTFTACITGCKKWEDHTLVKEQNLNITLLQEISQIPSLSKFYEYVQKTGLDKDLASSKNYTVWAPSDAALQSIDPAIVADTAKLKKLLLNHIAYQTYFTRDAQVSVRVVMLNSKRVTFTNTKFDEGNITEADKYVANGVLHIIDKIAPVLDNAWELVNNTKAEFQQSAFILAQNFNGFDPSAAIIDSISSVTGLPVYRPGTGLVARNSFNDQVYDLKNEQKQYTYFILNNTGLNTEVNKLKPYFATGSIDSTTNLASFAVVKDLVVDTFISSSAQLPVTLTSKSGVVIPIDKSKIVETRRISNGIVYVMSGISFSPKDKIPTIIVQGEGPRIYFNVDGSAIVNPAQNNVSATFTRLRINRLTGLPYTDIIVYNHGVSGLNARYQAPNVSSLKYKVYWVAVNDTFTLNVTINPVAFNQKLVMESRSSTTFPYVPVTPLNYSEVYLGDFIKSTYGTLDMFLTANGTTAITLDYIKLVPDL